MKNIKHNTYYNMTYPQIIIQGSNCLLIEGIEKLTHCTDDCVKVLATVKCFSENKNKKKRQVEISILGENLFLEYITSSTIEVSGNIISVGFSDE